jgi:Putative auto-transporter adhesin, head GIN domain
MKRINVLLLSSFIVLSSCHYIGGERVRGNGSVKTETRSVGSFSGIRVGGAYKVYLLQDSLSSVKIEADENLQEYIQIGVDDNVLEIRTERGFNLRPTGKIKVYVSAPDLKYFNASGACEIIGQNSITSAEPVNIDLSGASNISMDLKAPRVHAELSGAGTISLAGETKDFNVDGSGSTDIRCFDLKSENTSVEISGAGNAEVFASVKLDVRVSGAGDVKYKGSPEVNQRISGAGSVKKVE